jgi:transcription antitermination factor NusG
VESRLGPGRRVRVRNGPFAGLEGTVASRRGKTRLVLHVDFLQQGASVEIEDFQVEPVD